MAAIAAVGVAGGAVAVVVPSRRTTANIST
jgi:hypothetical protein